MSLGLYLHIPYCFPNAGIAISTPTPEAGVPDAYVDALLRELARFAPDAPCGPIPCISAAAPQPAQPGSGRAAHPCRLPGVRG